MGVLDVFKSKKTKVNSQITDAVNKSNCLPEITVEWDCCCCVTTISTKDLSNVVLDLDNGYRKFDNLSGYEMTFCVEEGELIKGVWVKSGCNQNEDPEHPCPEGNGCGEYFENPNYPECDCECGGGTTGGKDCCRITLTWGSELCRKVDSHLEMTGGVINYNGYVLPVESTLKELSVSWSDITNKKYAEKLIIQKNGVDVAGAEFELKYYDGVSTKYKTNLNIPFSQGDTINVISREIDGDTWIPACNVVFLALLKPKFKEQEE